MRREEPPKNRLGLFRLDLETRVGADEHIHQRALADAKPERVAEHETQPLIGQCLEALVINGQRMNARPERRRGGDRRRRSFRLCSAMLAVAGKAPVADDVGGDRRDFDFVVFADQLHIGVRRHGAAAKFAMGWSVIADFVGIVGEPPIVRLMAGLRTARTGILALLFLVGGRRLRRRARVFLGPLKLQHQFDQLLLAELLQITSIHAPMDSDFLCLGKRRS